MDIMITRTVHRSIHAVSPLLGTGADAAAATAAAEAAGPATAAALGEEAAAIAGTTAGESAAVATLMTPRIAKPKAREAKSFFISRLSNNAAAFRRAPGRRTFLTPRLKTAQPVPEEYLQRVLPGLAG